MKRLRSMLLAWLLTSWLCLWLVACDGDTARRGHAEQTDLAMVMLSAAADDRYLRAQGRREFEFPRDHGRHDGYRNEWWYVTGHLQTDAGRQFGYQLTFFRVLVRPPAGAGQAEPTPASGWTTAAIWLAQAAVSDIQRQRFLTSEQLSRELAGAAYAADDRLLVRLNRWSLRAPEAQPLASTSMELFMDSDDFSLALTLQAQKPVVLQGDNGLDLKSADAEGSASWYYSVTRLRSAGTLTLHSADGPQTFAVHGSSWLDREWGTSALSPRQSGWDWFALQLDNGHELMFYRLRRDDGSIDQASAGVLVDPHGRVTRLRRADIKATPLASWYSRQSGKTYPVSWALQSAAGDWQLRIQPLLPNQAWNGRFQYWEGAVRVHGEWRGDDIEGRGYVELTGYD